MIRRIAGGLPLALGMFALLVAAWDASAIGASPQLNGIRKIYVGPLNRIAHRHGKTVLAAYGSDDEVRKRLVSAIVASGRFSAVEKESDADARLDGVGGYVKTEEGVKKFTTGLAELKLVDLKSNEIVWTFEYRPQAGAGGSAAQRVADQFIQALIADAKVAAAR